MDTNNLQTEQIEIKAYPDDKNEIAFYVRASEIRIYWGDGNIDSIFSNGYGKIYNHLYSNKNLQTIKVDTYRMTEFDCSLDSPLITGTFCELRFSDCSKLNVIKCYKQSLTSLEIK